MARVLLRVLRDVVVVVVGYMLLLLAFNYVFDRPTFAALDGWRDYVGPAVGIAIYGILRFRVGMRGLASTESKRASQ